MKGGSKGRKYEGRDQGEGGSMEGGSKGGSMK